jgi:hypothetical protein
MARSGDFGAAKIQQGASLLSVVVHDNVNNEPNIPSGFDGRKHRGGGLGSLTDTPPEPDMLAKVRLARRWVPRGECETHEEHWKTYRYFCVGSRRSCYRGVEGGCGDCTKSTKQPTDLLWQLSGNLCAPPPSPYHQKSRHLPGAVHATSPIACAFEISLAR